MKEEFKSKDESESRLSCRINSDIKKRFINAANKRGLDLTSWIIEAGNEKMDRESK